MGEIVNLRSQRRRLEKRQAAQQAADNRSRFGRTGPEKRRDEIEAARRQAALDGARLETDPPTEA